jgi:hypothetical protein
LGAFKIKNLATSDYVKDWGKVALAGLRMINYFGKVR